MSLYTSVYWTKRVLVGLAIVVFICGGIRVFQFVSSSLTKNDIQVSEFKPEFGFGKIDRIEIDSMDVPVEFQPEFKISTTKGNLDADNGYPLEATVNPIANVYRITEREISLDTTEGPLRVAKKIGLTKEPEILDSTTRQWSEEGKVLKIEGLYNLVDYKNNNLRKTSEIVPGSVNRTDQNQLRTLFVNSLREFDITFPDQESYTFDGEYLSYDTKTSSFVTSGSLSSGSHLRVNARRIYPNLVKTNNTAAARGIYPGGVISSNSVILPASMSTSTSSTTLISQIAELSLYNWPVNQTIAANNPNVQTYGIKTPRQALIDMQNGNAYLVSAYRSTTRESIDLNEISDITNADILAVRIDNYESKTYRRFIQPVYVFTVEIAKNNQKNILIYYVPAVLESQLL